ncbi:MAG: isochorismatase family protein [Solirubrobacterales bacterium]|nr:isochorismatase family protein [Solirubrobacterales bacterium]
MTRRVEAESTALILVDFQERFAGAVKGFDAAVSRASVLASMAQILEIKIVVTEQYPQGLGVTVSTLRAALGEYTPLEKTVFPATRAEGFDLGGATAAIVAGVEAHVCVAQTVLDLLDAEIQVHVVADAVASRSNSEKDAALARLRDEGAVITMTEAVLFELTGGSSHPRFKELQGLVK